jgi:hypothetical protein
MYLPRISGRSQADFRPDELITVEGDTLSIYEHERDDSEWWECRIVQLKGGEGPMPASRRGAFSDLSYISLAKRIFSPQVR